MTLKHTYQLKKYLLFTKLVQGDERKFNTVCHYWNVERNWCKNILPNKLKRRIIPAGCVQIALFCSEVRDDASICAMVFIFGKPTGMKTRGKRERERLERTTAAALIEWQLNCGGTRSFPGDTIY